MKRLAFIIIVFCMVIIQSRVAFCCGPAVLGGYDVSKIAMATLDNLKGEKALTDEQYSDLSKMLVAEPADPLAWSTSYIDLYERLGALLVERGVATKENVESIYAAAREGGGAKIAGINPVVLAAGFLDLIARKGILSLPQAQSILDSAKSP